MAYETLIVPRPKSKYVIKLEIFYSYRKRAHLRIESIKLQKTKAGRVEGGEREHLASD